MSGFTGTYESLSAMWSLSLDSVKWPDGHAPSMFNPEILKALGFPEPKPTPLWDEMMKARSGFLGTLSMWAVLWPEYKPPTLQEQSDQHWAMRRKERWNHWDGPTGVDSCRPFGTIEIVEYLPGQTCKDTASHYVPVGYKGWLPYVPPPVKTVSDGFVAIDECPAEDHRKPYVPPKKPADGSDWLRHRTGQRKKW